MKCQILFSRKSKKISSLSSAELAQRVVKANLQYLVCTIFPGQYTGINKPLPEYHVKVAGFDQRVNTKAYCVISV